MFQVLQTHQSMLNNAEELNENANLLNLVLVPCSDVRYRPEGLFANRFLRVATQVQQIRQRTALDDHLAHGS